MDEEDDKQIEEEEVFMHITKEEIMIAMMEVINLEFFKLSVFIVKNLVLL